MYLIYNKGGSDYIQKTLPLTNGHPSYVVAFLIPLGWPHKRGTTVAQIIDSLLMQHWQKESLVAMVAVGTIIMTRTQAGSLAFQSVSIFEMRVFIKLSYWI